MIKNLVLCSVFVILISLSACNDPKMRVDAIRSNTPTYSISPSPTFIPILLTPTSASNPRFAAEKEVYSLLIFGPDNVFEEYTTLGSFKFSSQSIEYVKKYLPTVDQETLLDLEQKNTQSNLLKDYLPVNKDYVFLSDTKVQQIHKNRWQNFSNEYPYTDRIISYSQIGFNSDFTQALVLEDNNVKVPDEFGTPGTFNTDGAEVLIFLKKVDDKWTVETVLVVQNGS